MLLLLSLLLPGGAQPLGLDDWTVHPLIAHALGGIDGHVLTNSKEALEANYANGFRVFETDLTLTADGALVARHDWGPETYDRLGQPGLLPVGTTWYPLPLETFLLAPMNGRYHAMTWTDELQLMASHPDLFYVLDTKYTDEKTIRKQYRQIVEEAERIDPALLRRIIPQIYNQDMLRTIDDIYPFSSYIYTLYQSRDTNDEVVAFAAADPRIAGIAMTSGRATRSFVQRLERIGVRTYVHTVNSKAEFDRLRENGVYGIYTDSVQVSDLLRSLKGSWTSRPPQLPTASEIDE